MYLNQLIYIYHVVLIPQISLTLSLAILFYYPSLAADLLDYILCLYRVVVEKFLLVGQYLHVHVKGSIRDRLYFSFSLLNVLFVLFGCFWDGSCCFGRCCVQDLFNIARSILVQFPSDFFSIHFVRVHVVHPYGWTDTTAAWYTYLYRYLCTNVYESLSLIKLYLTIDVTHWNKWIKGVYRKLLYANHFSNGVTIIGVGSLINHLEVAGSILTAGE